MKLIKKTLMINVVIILSILSNISLCYDHNQEKATAYPNLNEPPTSAEYLRTANFTIPLMSDSLKEQIIHRRLRKSDFLTFFGYGSYSLTRGETEQIFNFIDQNKDDLIDNKEWIAFSTLFILPFEACLDLNRKKYLLKVKEFALCWDKDPKTQVIEFGREQEANKYELLMEVVSTRGKSEINFADYLFLRRAMFGWKNCHSSNDYISITAFNCALRESIPQKYISKDFYNNIYMVGKKLANNSKSQLDFINYLRTLNFAYIFTIIALPNHKPSIEKTQFIKALREDRIPLNISEEEVNIWYDLTDPTPFKQNKFMGFETFAFFYNYHRLFFKYNKEKSSAISKKEVLKCLKDPYFPGAVLEALDVANTNFTEKEYLNVSSILKRIRLNERDFYFASLIEKSDKRIEKFRFKQDDSTKDPSNNDKTSANKKNLEKKRKEESRETFFNIMTSMDKKYLSLYAWYRAAVLTNFFKHIHGIDEKFWCVGATQFIDIAPSKWDSAVPLVGLDLRKNYNFYKMLPRELQLNILDYLCMENFIYKVGTHKNDGTKKINESLLKVILKDCGMMNMPDTILDLTLEGNDVLGRREYDFTQTLVNVITVHTAAGDELRSRARIEDYGIKENFDLSREFSRKVNHNLRISPFV